MKIHKYFKNWKNSRQSDIKISNVLWMNEHGKGIIIFTYGNDNYLISSKAAEKLTKQLSEIFNKYYPNFKVVLIPYYVSLDSIFKEGEWKPYE